MPHEHDNPMMGNSTLRACLTIMCLCLIGLHWAPPSVQAGTGPVDEIAPIVAPFPMRQLKRPVFSDRTFDVRAYGARSVEGVKNTRAIQSAIDAAAKAGGGTVVVPRGRWLTGGLHLDDGVNLNLAGGAELLFSQDPADYLPVVFSRHEDIECYKHSAFIYADGKSNIAITGEGTLNGQGKPWWRFKTDQGGAEALLDSMVRAGVPVGARIFDGTPGRTLRPAFFQPMNCSHVLVEGVTFRYGAFWTITPTYCDDVIIRRVRVVTEGDYGHTPNGDGIDLSSCRDVLIENCDLDTGDDCIALKAGRNADGLRVNRPTENVVIRHCRALRGHGGVTIGSETAGGIRNVLAEDCTFSRTDRMVRVKSARGRGGVIENMWFRNLTADTIRMEAIHISMLYAGQRFPAESVSVTTPRVRSIRFEDISCGFAGGEGIAVAGLPEMPLGHIEFQGIMMHAAGGISCTDGTDIVFRHMRVLPEKWPVVTLTDCKAIIMDSFFVPRGSNPFVALRNVRPDDIRVSRMDTSSTARFMTIQQDSPSVPAARRQGSLQRTLQTPDDERSWSRQIADAFLARHRNAVTFDSTLPEDRWTYEQGLMLEAFRQMWQHTGRQEYLDFIRNNVDQYVKTDGSIRTYNQADYNLDNIAGGRSLLFLYGRTKSEKYRIAAATLRRQLKEQPRTNEGGFWHKKIYPYQMWLDGLYMAEPFYAAHAATFDEPSAFDDIAFQFERVYRHTLDSASGLCYHGWDESRVQRWADPSTGASPSFWGRAMGWYMMGLVDVLDWFPNGHPQRTGLIGILRSLASAILRARDPESRLWYQVVDAGGRAGNYLESSCSSMFIYAFAKGSRLGYLDEEFAHAATESFTALTGRLVTRDPHGMPDLRETCKGAGLGGTPYRDGSYQYYIGVPRTVNDMKGVGAFLLAAIEIEKRVETNDHGDR